MPNGAIYICETSVFLTNKSFISKKTIPFLMSKNSSVDIDKREDLDKIVKILQND